MRSLANNNNYTIWDKITLFNKEFTITGIYETGSMITDNSYYTSLNTLQEITNNSNIVSLISVKINNNATIDTVNMDIKNQYGNELTTITSEDMANTTEKTMSMIDSATTTISLLAIVIGGLGVINTMMMTVFERTREIGVLKSVGWKNNRILFMILGESIVITLIAGIIGTILGILAVNILV